MRGEAWGKSKTWRKAGARCIMRVRFFDMWGCIGIRQNDGLGCRNQGIASSPLISVDAK